MTYFLDAGIVLLEMEEALSFPVVEYGIKANRKILETATRYSYDQGLTPRRLELEEIFTANTLDE